MYLLPAIDPPPSKWVDPEEFYPDITEEEIEAGNRLGQEIDIDNPRDNGLGGLPK